MGLVCCHMPMVYASLNKIGPLGRKKGNVKQTVQTPHLLGNFRATSTCSWSIRGEFDPGAGGRVAADFQVGLHFGGAAADVFKAVSSWTI